MRLQGKIANLTDKGIKVHWFLGNHDMWIFDYIPKELGVELHESEIECTFNGKLFGYNMQSVAELNDKMKDDVKVVLAEYRLALKKNNADREI